MIERLINWILRQDFETKKEIASEMYMSVSELEEWLKSL